MLIRCYLAVSFFLIALYGKGQAVEAQDSTLLNEVVVRGFANDRPLIEIPAAIGYLDQHSLERFNNASILPAANTIPGVRMEERSPGSYRFSIRGSLLRSPFGVRNVKMYWNGLPLTDGGGNTYLNLIDIGSMGSMEVIKGPGSSLYGSGTGGVVLLSNPHAQRKGIQFSSTVGNFGLQRYAAAYSFGADKVKGDVRFAHLRSEGYREQTEMYRTAVNTDFRFITGRRSSLSWMSFYSDLFYETPGGLTLSQFESDPKMARPGTPVSPGAVEQQAAVYNKTIYSGLSYELQWSPKWFTRTGIFSSYSAFENPSIRNYESRKETNVGGRTETHYTFEKSAWKGKLLMGVEAQYFTSPIGVYDNDGGIKTSVVQSEDDLTSTQGLGFLQAEFEFPRDYFVTIGGSASLLSYHFLRKNPLPEITQQRNFNAEFSPRVALLKKLSSTVSLYGSISNGFSAPSLAEVRPSTNTFNNNLNAERGTNYEIGVRGHTRNQVLQFDLTFYDFQLRDAIVIQRAADGAEFFINAGKTSQKGIEAQLTLKPHLNTSSFITDLSIRNNYTYNHYRFVDYVQDGSDYSGNHLTGVPPLVYIMMIDIEVLKTLGFNFTGNFTDHIPLDDLNANYASSYVLMSIKAVYKGLHLGKAPVSLFVGANNLLNEKYSLGNDLNAFGGRFYNAAPTRNYFGGLSLNLKN